MKQAIYKVPNGKLLKVFLESDGERIASIKITGDFFLYPEERIEKLEQYLVSCKLTESGLTQKITIFFKQFPTELYGIDVPSLVHVILMASQ